MTVEADTIVTLHHVPGTNLAYLIVREQDDEPEVVQLGAAWVTPADRARRAAVQAGWIKMIHEFNVTLTSGERARVEFYRGSM